MHRLALAARQVVFYVLWNCLAWDGFVENNGGISSNFAHSSLGTSMSTSAKPNYPPPFKLRWTFQRSMAFAANAQWPPCRRVSCSTLCLGTMRWRRSPELFDIVASLNLHEQILGFHASCFLQKTRLGPPTSSTFSISLASFTGVWNSRAFLLFSVPRKIYFIETPASKPHI